MTRRGLFVLGSSGLAFLVPSAEAHASGRSWNQLRKKQLAQSPDDLISQLTIPTRVYFFLIVPTSLPAWWDMILLQKWETAFTAFAGDFVVGTLITPVPITGGEADPAREIKPLIADLSAIFGVALVASVSSEQSAANRELYSGWTTTIAQRLRETEGSLEDARSSAEEVVAELSSQPSDPQETSDRLAGIDFGGIAVDPSNPEWLSYARHLVADEYMFCDQGSGGTYCSLEVGEEGIVAAWRVLADGTVEPVELTN